MKGTSTSDTFPFQSRCFVISIFYFFCLNLSILYAQHSVSTLCGSSIQGNPLAGPNGICISPDGNTVYVADYSAHRIKSVNVSSHAVTNLAGSGTNGYADGPLASAQFSYPSGIKISADGLSLYVADNANCLIRKLDLVSNTVSTIAGVYYAFSYLDHADGLQAMFNQPVDLVIAPGDSVLYISDSENHIIRKLNLITTSVTTIAGVPGSNGSNDGPALTARFRNPKGLALSSDGNLLYVADGGNHKVRVVDLVNATVSTLAGSGVAGSDDNASGILATFNTLQGVSLLPNDSLLYVMDTYSNLIRCINVQTTAVTTIAGSLSTAQQHFADNADGLQSKFYHPVNATMAADGSALYISDQENFRVRIVNTDLVVTGTEAKNFPNFSVYPNPVFQNLFVRMPASTREMISYLLCDITGKHVAEGAVEMVSPFGATIYMSQLTPGIYSLRLMSGNNFKVIKVIKSTIE